MAKQLDPVIGDVLKKHGFDKKAVWDCHGTWVIYHNVLEKIAAKEGIVFTQPHICSSDVTNVAVCVTGEYEKHAEWSIGEASPKNCKNAYPWAMAEKRAKDRVILKLIGLAGVVYSEEEAYDLKATGKGVWEANEEPVKEPENPTVEWKGPIKKHALQTQLRAFNVDITSVEDSGSMQELMNQSKEIREQCEIDLPEWFGPMEVAIEKAGKRVEGK